MFFGIILKKDNKTVTLRTDANYQTKKRNSESDEIDLLRLKLEKLQCIQETENERDKTVDNNATMLIGYMVTDVTNPYSYVNMCILLFLSILIYCLGRSIIYSVLTLRKRVYYQLGIDDLEDRKTIKELYFNLIKSTIKIIKHNENVINSKVDSMLMAQECFIDFWIWTVLFLINLVAYNLFLAYEISMSFKTPFMLVVTFVISGIGYLIGKSLVKKIKESDKVDKIAPNVDKEIRAVCMMSVSSADNEEKENL